MTNKRAALALGAAMLLNISAVQAAEDKNIAAAATTPATETAVTASTSNAAAEDIKTVEMIDFDPVDPKSWAMALDPRTHGKVHGTVTNPRFYTRFMTPAYFTKFMNPKTWMSYMDMSTYQPLIKVVSDPATARHWVKPTSYMRELTHASYAQIVDPQTYVAMGSTVTENLKSEPSEATYAMFNPMAWMKTFTEVATAAATQTSDQAAKAIQSVQ